MSDLSQSIEIRDRVKVSPNGQARKVPIAECPRCHRDVDLKGHKLENGESELVYKTHYDDLTRAFCPTAGITPDRAVEWQRETREKLGI